MPYNALCPLLFVVFDIHDVHKLTKDLRRWLVLLVADLKELLAQIALPSASLQVSHPANETLRYPGPRVVLGGLAQDG